MKLHGFTREQNISKAINQLRSEHRQLVMSHRAITNRYKYYVQMAHMNQGKPEEDEFGRQALEFRVKLLDLDMDRQDIDLRAKELGITL